RIDREDDVARLTEQRLAQCFGTPFRIGEAELRISAKVGLAVFPNDGADADTLFKNAEAALKKAKETNERYLFYTHELTERIAERLSLENKLRQALERQEFVLHYQPKVETDTRRVSIVEAAIKRGASPHGLDLEITESLLMEEVAANIEKLRALRELGVSVSIDDFGTGYSSLGYLAKLPVQSLKIDRSFIITMLKE